jgi:hypothetical protein
MSQRNKGSFSYVTRINLLQPTLCFTLQIIFAVEKEICNRQKLINTEQNTDKNNSLKILVYLLYNWYASF